jgi:helicase
VSRSIYRDVIGNNQRANGVVLSSLGLPDSVSLALIEFLGGDLMLSPPQYQAFQSGLLNDLAHFLVSTPTNSGKTLIALLRIFHRIVLHKSRFVYVVPLKALAEEKLAEIEQIAVLIEKHNGPKIKVNVSTGDYNLSGDFMGSPPKEGEILICTPEKLEILLRNPDNTDWARQVDTYILDEFHLLGEKGRGATMEVLVTRLLTMAPESSLMALSATIGKLDSIIHWLALNGITVRVIESNYRYPELNRNILYVEDKDAFIVERSQEVLADSLRSLIIFVYRKNDTEKLAQLLQKHCKNKREIAYFHSGVSFYDRLTIGQQFHNREVRILVSTTSLKMGVNTPASDVIVRDTVFHGFGRLVSADISQMIGRAGRGEVPGHAFVLCSGQENGETYAQDFAEGRIDPLVPQLISINSNEQWYSNKNVSEDTSAISALVLSEVSRHKEIAIQDVIKFISKTYSSVYHSLPEQDLSLPINFLATGKLIYKAENSESTYCATKLGRTVSQTGLSPESGAMLAGFIRSLINLGEKQKENSAEAPSYLHRLTQLDLLFLASASFEARGYLLPCRSKQDRVVIEEYVERLPLDQKPLLNLWRSPTSEKFPTRRLISSLRFKMEIADSKQAETLFYRLMKTAILLHQHANGKSLSDLALDFKEHHGTLEGGLKFTVTWVLNCLAQICSGDKCYKLDFLAMECFELLEDISLGATLGKLMTVKGIGRKTITKIMASGVSDIQQLRGCTVEQFILLGLNANQAKSIHRWVNRRNR